MTFFAMGFAAGGYTVQLTDFMDVPTVTTTLYSPAFPMVRSRRRKADASTPVSFST